MQRKTQCPWNISNITSCQCLRCKLSFFSLMFKPVDGEQDVASEGCYCLSSVAVDYKLLQITVCIHLESDLSWNEHIQHYYWTLAPFICLLLFVDNCFYFSCCFCLFVHGMYLPCFLRLSSFVALSCPLPCCDTHQQAD